MTDIKNKTVEQLKSLKVLGLREISLGSESGDDWTLYRVNKNCSAADITEQCESSQNIRHSSVRSGFLKKKD